MEGQTGLAKTNLTQTNHQLKKKQAGEQLWIFALANEWLILTAALKITSYKFLSVYFLSPSILLTGCTWIHFSCSCYTASSHRLLAQVSIIYHTQVHVQDSQFKHCIKIHCIKNLIFPPIVTTYCYWNIILESAYLIYNRNILFVFSEWTSTWIYMYPGANKNIQMFRFFYVIFIVRYFWHNLLITVDINLYLYLCRLLPTSVCCHRNRFCQCKCQVPHINPW